MSNVIRAPISFYSPPEMHHILCFYKVVTAFTNASVGDIFVRANFLTFFQNLSIGGADIENPYSCWFNLNNKQAFDESAVNLANLVLLNDSSSGSSSGADTVTAINKVSSSLSTLNNTTNVLVSNVSNNLSSTNSLLNSANALNTSMNSNLLSISSGIGQVSSGIAGISPTAGNAFLSSINATLSTAFATATLNVEAIATNTTRTYSNVKSAIITAQPVLLATTLNTSSIQVNGAVCSLNSPITIAIPPNTKLSNNLVISNGNLPVTVIYTT